MDAYAAVQVRVVGKWAFSQAVPLVLYPEHESAFGFSKASRIAYVAEVINGFRFVVAPAPKEAK